MIRKRKYKKMEKFPFPSLAYRLNKWLWLEDSFSFIFLVVLLTAGSIFIVLLFLSIKHYKYRWTALTEIALFLAKIIEVFNLAFTQIELAIQFKPFKQTIKLNCKSILLIRALLTIMNRIKSKENLNPNTHGLAKKEDQDGVRTRNQSRPLFK